MERSLNDEMHLSLKKFKALFSYSGWVIGITILFLGLAVIANYNIFQEFWSYGDFKTIEGCEEVDPIDTCYEFIPFSEDFEFSNEAMAYLYDRLFSTVLVLGGMIGVLGSLGIWLVIRGRRIKHKIDDLMSDYIRQSYLVNFETVTPKGETKQEKFFNIALTVFPELKEKYDQKTKKGKEYKYDVDKKLGKYVFDLILDTTEGKIGVKFFDKLTFKELEKVIKKSRKYFDDDGDRIICIAKEYEKFFEQEEFEEKIDDIHRQFNLDLILEEDLGYSIVWID